MGASRAVVLGVLIGAAFRFVPPLKRWEALALPSEPAMPPKPAVPPVPAFPPIPPVPPLPPAAHTDERAQPGSSQSKSPSASLSALSSQSPGSVPSMRKPREESPPPPPLQPTPVTALPRHAAPTAASHTKSKNLLIPTPVEPNPRRTISAAVVSHFALNANPEIRLARRTKDPTEVAPNAGSVDGIALGFRELATAGDR